MKQPWHYTLPLLPTALSPANSRATAELCINPERLSQSQYRCHLRVLLYFRSRSSKKKKEISSLALPIVLLPILIYSFYIQQSAICVCRGVGEMDSHDGVLTAGIVIAANRPILRFDGSSCDAHWSVIESPLSLCLHT